MASSACPKQSNLSGYQDSLNQESLNTKPLAMPGVSPGAYSRMRAYDTVHKVTGDNWLKSKIPFTLSKYKNWAIVSTSYRTNFLQPFPKRAQNKYIQRSQTQFHLHWFNEKSV